MNRFLQRAVSAVLGQYAVWRIFTVSARRSVISNPDAASWPMRLRAVDRSLIEHCPDELLREQAWYCGTGCEAFGCLDDSTLVGLCFFWHGERYNLGEFWPLSEREAMLMQVVTSQRVRGRGVAGLLIPFATAQMAERGFDRLVARVWHSNRPSWRAFAGAGWSQVATLVEIDPMRRGSPWRWVKRRRIANGVVDAPSDRRD